MQHLHKALPEVRRFVLDRNNLAALWPAVILIAALLWCIVGAPIYAEEWLIIPSVCVRRLSQIIGRMLIVLSCWIG